LKDVFVHSQEIKEKNKLIIELYVEKTDWREWIKTVGEVDNINPNSFNINFEGENYNVKVSLEDGVKKFEVIVNGNTKKDIYFMSAIKTALKKAAYCVGCRVCEANCPN